jgi:hypothetical protein
MLDSVIEQVQLWCDSRSSFNPSTIMPVTLIMCVQFPDMDVTSTVLRVQANLWVFALDDFLDDPGTTSSEAERVANDCRVVVTAALGSENPGTHYGLILSDIKNSLAKYPLFTQLWPIWSVSLVRLVDAMMFEYWTRLRNLGGHGRQTLPTIEEYLFFGRTSIGLPFIWMTNLVPCNDQSTLRFLAELIELADVCGELMRLANDRRSFGAEDLVGKINSLHLVKEEQRVQGSQTSLVSHVRRLQAQMREKARRISTTTGVEERFIRATEFGIEIYERSDFRTLAAEVLNEGTDDPR